MSLNAPNRCPFIHPALPVSLIASGEARCRREVHTDLPHRGWIGSDDPSNSNGIKGSITGTSRREWAHPAVAADDKRRREGKHKNG